MKTEQGLRRMARTIADDMTPGQVRRLLDLAAEFADYEIHHVVARWLDDMEDRIDAGKKETEV